MKHYISLGAGVQSSTLALMAAAGEITPMPDGAIFADTQGEPQSVYRWLDWLEKQLPFPVSRVTAGSLKDEALSLRVSKSGKSYFAVSVPWFLDDSGRHGIAKRQCTTDYKIAPFNREVKRLASIPRSARTPRAVVWMGISTDEIQRASPNRKPWIETRWPLLEKRMSRLACIEWMERKGFPKAPRSACTFCPYHSNAEWRRLRDEEPKAWADAVAVDEELRRKALDSVLRGTPYLHDSRVPLADVDLRSDVDRGQLLLWQDECTGYCGV